MFSFWVNLGATLFGALFLYMLKKGTPKMTLPQALVLFLIYVPFAFLEQTLFLFIILETAYSMTGKILLSSFVVSIYYRAFHREEHLKIFSFFFNIASLVWSVTYLLSGNIIWPALSMAALGPVYYAFLSGKSLSSLLNLKNI
jgi:fumarate reductase subunit D